MDVKAVPLLTLLVDPSGTPSADVAHTVDALTSSLDSIIVKVLATPDTTTSGLPAVFSADGAEYTPEPLSSWRDIGAVLRRQTTGFVGVVRARDSKLPEDLAELLAAFHDYPEIVLAVGAGTERSGTQEEAREAELAYPDERFMDGRFLARQLIGYGDLLLPTPSSILFRRTAIGPSDTRRAEPEADWLLWLCLHVLTRGPAWFAHSPAAISEIPRPSDGHWTSEGYSVPDATDHSLKLLTEGSSLGLLETLDDRESTSIELARRSASWLRSQIDAGGPRSAESGAQWMAALLHGLRTLLRPAEENPGPLPLHLIVRCDGTAATSPDAADRWASMAERLTFFDTASHTAANGNSGAVGSGAGSPVSPAALHRVITEVGLPAAVVSETEVVEILDDQQLGALLKGPRPEPGGALDLGAEGRDGDRGKGHLGTPLRLIWPDSLGEESEAAGACSAVHSARVFGQAPTIARDWMPSQTAIPSIYPRPFVIAAPDNTKIHGGVVALHRLCDRLNASGCEAYIEPLGEATGVTRPGWNTPLWPYRDFDDAIVIYPEIVTGNPFGARRIVRWLLNRPAWFTGEVMDEHPDDLIITFSPQIAPDYPCISMPLVDPTLFFPKDVPGRGDLLWIGKGQVPDTLDRSTMTLITSQWPGTRASFASLLRKADVLYTCDWLTAVIGEALMCATPVVLVGDQSWERSEISQWPGMTWYDEDGLADARKDAFDFYPHYIDSVERVDETIRYFLAVVERHFAALDSRESAGHAGP